MDDGMSEEFGDSSKQRHYCTVMPDGPVTCLPRDMPNLTSGGTVCWKRDVQLDIELCFHFI